MGVVDFAHSEVWILFPYGSDSPGFAKNGSDLDSLRHEPTTSELPVIYDFPMGETSVLGRRKSVAGLPKYFSPGANKYASSVEGFPPGEKKCRPWERRFPQGE